MIYNGFEKNFKFRWQYLGKEVISLQDAKIIKQNLENLINEMSQHPELWVKNPGKDFTRSRKLGFNKLIHLMLGMRGNSM